MAVIHQCIFVNPARASGVGANRWVDIRRQSACNCLQILHNSRARPIKIGSILKYYEYVAVVKHCLRAHGFHIRRGQQRCHNRVCDLILNNVGGLAFPVRMNNDLDVGDVRQGVKWDLAQAPDAGQSQQKNSRENKETIVRTPFDDTSNHDYIPPVALTESCLFAMVCPFCCAVIVTCHVPPEPRTALPSYIPPPLSLAWTTVFIAAIPIAGIAAMKKVTLTCAPAIGFPA